MHNARNLWCSFVRREGGSRKLVCLHAGTPSAIRSSQQEAEESTGAQALNTLGQVILLCLAWQPRKQSHLHITILSVLERASFASLDKVDLLVSCSMLSALRVSSCQPSSQIMWAPIADCPAMLSTVDVAPERQSCTAQVSAEKAQSLRIDLDTKCAALAAAESAQLAAHSSKEKLEAQLHRSEERSRYLQALLQDEWDKARASTHGGECA